MQRVRIMKTPALYFVLFTFFFVTSCGNQPLPAEAGGSTSPAGQSDDPCAPQNLPATVQPVNDRMREFDDAAQLASNLPAEQLPEIISNLQRIRREAEDIQIPTCLATLKVYQLNHMNLMIQTLLAVVGGADQETLNNGLEEARKEYDLYSLEIVRLLGITLAPVTPTAGP